MKINNIKINKFGKLENKEIEFGSNINIVYGKNESGKSTLLKFITSILYGLSKNKNGKEIPDMDRYLPWDEGDFSGRISYNLDNGNQFEVFREFKKKNPKIYDKNLNDISKEYTIDKTKGNMFFYEQVNVDEEMFLSTIVSEQQELKLEKQAQNNLIQKTANLAQTGDDNISFQKIISKLNKRQIEEIGTGRTQDRPLNIIEKRLKNIDSELENIEEIKEEMNIIAQNKKELINEIEGTSNKIEFIKQIKSIKEEEKLEEEKRNINKNLIKEYDDRISDINNKLENVINEQKKLGQEKIEKKNSILKNILIPVILVVLNLLLYIVLKNIPICIVCSAILIAYLTFIIISKQKENKRIKQYKEEKDKLTGSIKIIESELDAEEKKKQQKQNEIEKLKNEFYLKQNAKIDLLKSKYINEISEYEISRIINSDNISLNLEMTQNKLNEANLNIHRLEVDEKNILVKSEKISELEEERQELIEKYEELEKRNRVIELAKQEIENAYTEMKENISPKFTRLMSDNISKITNGKYRNVKINDDSTIMVETENGNYTPIYTLSVGTIEQLYLALRFSFVNEISNENLPIMLDEAFAYFDDTRTENFIKFLNDEYSTKQIIIFTCSNKEKNICDKLNLSYKMVELQNG